MTLTIRIYFIRFLFIALSGDLPGMYLFFFLYFCLLNIALHTDFMEKNFALKKKNAWQLTTYAFDRIKNYNAITVRLAFNFVCV